MKFALAVLTSFLTLTLTAFAADLSPTNPNVPVLRFFHPIPVKARGSTPPALTFDKQRPLLTVTKLRDLKLGRNGKSVLIRLTNEDASAFAELTRKYQRRSLLLVATDDVMQVLDVTGPVKDGALLFDQPDDAAVATYLRRRFRVGEFK
ncbi:MAG: hypothetical protein ABR589_10050 [Chthoniobacterales bacterium]